MPKSAQYIVSWSQENATYLFIRPENATSPSQSLVGEDWHAWLESHHSFAFHGRNGKLNLLKEKRNRGSEGYWYAYQRHGKQMLKRYIGRSSQLSMVSLEEMASSLSQEQVVEAKPRLPSEPASNLLQFEPLLMPKLQLPRLQKSLLPREHLLELLDKGMERKVTLIAGPAGYGKTTLVGQWIAERGTRPNFPRVASVTLDEGDNDPIRFWRYIIAACQKFRTDFGKEALELLLAHRLPPFKPLEFMLTSLLNELSQLDHSSILILDDFHMISSPQVFETLNFFLDHLPTSFHLILLIRGDLPFSLARLRARNELLDIYPPDLGFSLDETRAFLEQELSFTLSPKIVRQIHERLEGWPTGLRLLTSTLRWPNQEQEIENMLSTFEGSYWSFQDYFLNEVLQTLSTEQQDFLFQTSVLPRITASLCNAVTGLQDSTRLLAELRGGDLFLAPLDRIGEWSRYQSFFAEVMQQEARRRLGDERLRRISAGASIWYEEHGLLTEAIETALDATDFSRAAHLIELIQNKQQSEAPTVLELYSLHRWAERLPEDELKRHPDLCIQFAMTILFLFMEGPRLPDKKERIQTLLQLAEQHWRDANNTAKLAEVFAFRALLARQEGKMLQAVTWAKQSLAWLPSEDRRWRNLDLSVVGMGEMLDGSIANARESLLEAYILSEQQGNLTYARATQGMLTWASFEQGELRHAAEQFRQMQAEARAQEDSDDIARTQSGLAQLAYQWNNLEEAKLAAQETLEIGEQMQVEEFQVFATIRLALVENARGQAALAKQRLTSWLARAQMPISPHSYQLHHQVQSTLARIQLASGELTAVEHWFAANEKREENLPRLQRQREQLLYARLLIAQGAIPTAIEQLESLYTSAIQTGHRYFSIESQVVLILALSRQGSHEKARKQLHQLLETTRAEGYLRLYLDEGEEMADLLRALLPHLREKTLLAYVRQILNAFAQEINSPENIPNTTLLLDPISPQEQKVLRLLVAGNSNAEIARQLVVSVNTVRTQVQSIYRKLNVNNRVEASSVAHQLELV
jgi:LuxR family maltose regulon positive regulatory protein